MEFSEAFSLTGHRALITGGASGLGLAAAECFLKAGAEVVLVGREEEKLHKATTDLGAKASGFKFDVTDFDGAADLAEKVEQQKGPISILVNNAGNTVKKPIEEMSVEEFKQVFDIHVTGAFALTRAFLPQLKKTGKGSALFTASMSSFLGIPNVSGYAASKAAYVGLIRSFATELAPSGVRVNGVAPGWIDTPLFRFATLNDPKRLEKIMGRIPMNCTGQPEDIGWAMVYLASNAARYVTGHITVVDGGALHSF
ncbi:gluconate 5-dehydrogenase [Cohaesibacter sp. ES.047]|uniref:SDR family NAD(P)-dependent oxidoreductase n=1 Tax=Cohaesibacter sp. ES.047 TaxID=1798205 RepID=UPI000BB93115|nr:SDR family oxidoreductase [Cohaesibacter sp. ES.047]SNY90265.1 gluconate 5-dehydrogenase [Cohaesibacter sp. ES.047]